MLFLKVYFNGRYLVLFDTNVSRSWEVLEQNCSTPTNWTDYKLVWAAICGKDSAHFWFNVGCLVRTRIGQSRIVMHWPDYNYVLFNRPDCQLWYFGKALCSPLIQSGLFAKNGQKQNRSVLTSWNEFRLQSITEINVSSESWGRWYSLMITSGLFAENCVCFRGVQTKS